MQQQNKTIKVVVISDTHGQEPIVPPGDILVHCGDFSRAGSVEQVTRFVNYLKKQPHKYKVVIAGNHDIIMDPTNYEKIYRKYNYTEPKSSPQEMIKFLKDNCIYLEHESVVVEGLRIFGSPHTPQFCEWAFMTKPEQAQKLWDPSNPDFANLDLLITHGPPYGILDKVRKDNVGCRSLLKLVETVQPKHHVFGHIHEGYGQWSNGKTTFSNCSVLNQRYKLKNAPLVLQFIKS